MEYAKSAIRVEAVRLGVIRTPVVELAAGGGAEAEVRFAALVVMGCIGSPEKVAEAGLWLCSGTASCK